MLLQTKYRCCTNKV